MPRREAQLGSNATVSGASPIYQWLSNGNPAPGGNGSSFNVPTGNSGAGVDFTACFGGRVTREPPILVNVTEELQPADGSTEFSQSTIAAGGSDTLASATGSECGDPVTVSYTASEGSINGNTYDSTGVSFDQNAGRLQTKVIRITATARDRTGATATANADRPSRRSRWPGDWKIWCSRPTARESTTAPASSAKVLPPEIRRSDPNARDYCDRHRDTSEKVTTLDRARVLNAAAVLSAPESISVRH